MAQNVLEWTDNSSDETGFSIERKPRACASSPDDYTEIATVGAGVVTYTDTAVTEGTTYCYRVRAFNGAGYSSYSNTAERTVPDETPPVVVITSPTTSATYSTSSTVELSGTFSDAFGVTSMFFFNALPGLFGTVSFTPGTSGTWATTDLGNTLQAGSNLVSIFAADAAGNTGSDSITIIYTPSTLGSASIKGGIFVIQR